VNAREVDMEDTINKLQEQVNDALLNGDRESLSQLIAPDARIIGPKGFEIGRDEWIGVHQETRYEQVKLVTTESVVRTMGKSGIRFDVVESECRYHGESIAGRFRVIQVWDGEGDREQLVAVQYTTISG
jgi:hypothetical protein